MAENVTLPPVDHQLLFDYLSNLSLTDLVAVTLIDTNILLGGLFTFWGDLFAREDIVALSFNTDEGKCYGDSHIVYIPLNHIAAITRIPLNENSAPKLPISSQLQLVQILGDYGTKRDIRLPAKNYPNPLASIISHHNMSLITTIGLELWGYSEKALSQDAIPPEGIHFDNDFLIYADWSFFGTQSQGSVSFSAAPIPGLINIEKNLSQSLEHQVLQKLKDSFGGKINRSLSPSFGKYITIQGSLLVPNPTQDESIEDELCYLFKIATDQKDDPICPVLMKVRRLKFPIGFLNQISSKLVFYGELLPIPVSILGQFHKHVLLARAIAFIQE